jgi:hypothetical protein
MVVVQHHPKKRPTSFDDHRHKTSLLTIVIPETACFIADRVFLATWVVNRKTTQIRMQMRNSVKYRGSVTPAEVKNCREKQEENTHLEGMSLKFL